MKAHGGLDRWYSSGLLSIRYNYKGDSGKPHFDTAQIVDTWSARASHKVTGSPELRFGWDGTNAWKVDPKKSLKINPRFWSLTPYYFVGITFVFADKGINLTLEGSDRYKGTDYYMVKATFDDGVGDAPDDYYIIYIHKKDSTVDAIRYVVSYKGFFPEGGHTPESFMEYNGSQTVSGVILPTSYRSYAWDPKSSKVGDAKASVTLSDVTFIPWNESLIVKPPMATVVTEF